METLDKHFRTLTKADLLILDDWGPDRLSANHRRDLMEIVEDRYGSGATLITSQLPVDTWHEVIAEPTFADAILDRLVHNAYRLTLDGPSMRKIKAVETEVSVPAGEIVDAEIIREYQDHIGWHRGRRFCRRPPGGVSAFAGRRRRRRVGR